MAGEYLSESRFDSFTYIVSLKQPGAAAAFAHASWIGDQAVGLLLLDDLLPQFGSSGKKVSAKVRLQLPADWTSALGNDFVVDDLSRSVVMIGKGIRRLEAGGKAGSLSVFLFGDFQFAPNEAAQIAREIFEEYSKTLGELPRKDYRIFLMKLPPTAGFGSWEAGTVGSTVTIVTGDATFASTALQRLHEQLRHEIFHLWMPNGLSLTGDYAWFYEGFALYQSLRLGVRLNRIRFDDFLDTLSRAYTIDANAKPRLPLTSPPVDPTVRYARGMLVAFLFDLQLIANARGRSDVTSILRTLFQSHGENAQPADAAETLKSVMKASETLDRFVFGAEPIEWSQQLSAAGIESKQAGRTTALAVAAKLSGRQKEILDRLGYNNWRKIGAKK
jgi:predicted metalloprotease with PDZ domain